MIRRNLALAVSLLFPLTSMALAQEPPPEPGPGTQYRVPARFTENLGQWSTPARFVTRSGGITIGAESDRLLVRLQRASHPAGNERDRFGARGREEEERERLVEGHLLRISFEDASPETRLEGLDRQSAPSHFFFGNDPSKWRTNVPSYGCIAYRELYPGIDLVLYRREGRFEYDLLVQPGADLSRFAARVEGTEGLRIGSSGDLVIETSLGDLRQSKPRTWIEAADGEKRPIASHFVLLGEDRYGFEIGDHPAGGLLVLDPSLEWSTYLGGTSFDGARDIVVDSSDDVTVVGETESVDFPTSPGAYSENASPEGDIFVTKFSATGQLVFSTYIGGSDSDRGFGVANSSSGGLIVGGQTWSPDFPLVRPLDNTLTLSDAIVLELDASGGQIRFSTFLGGSSHDGALAVTVDPTSGEIYVAGITFSQDFPTTRGAAQELFGGPRDAFVSKIDSVSSTLVASTYLGGAGDERGLAIALTPNGQPVVTGDTDSPDFPITPGAFQTAFAGTFDAFVTRLHSIDLSLDRSTFLGGPGADVGQAVTVDPSGGIIVGGGALGGFPTTSGAFDESYAGGSDGFVTALDTGFAALSFSTYIGGAGFDRIMTVHSDSRGLVAGGYTRSSDFPTTHGAFDRSLDGSADAFALRLSPDASQLRFSSFLGGSAFDQAGQGARLSDGGFVLTGVTESPDYPVTPGAFDSSLSGGIPPTDTFVTALRLGPLLELEGAPTPGTPVRVRLHSAPSAETGARMQIVLSCTLVDPGFPLPGGHSLPFRVDPCTSRGLAVATLLSATVKSDGTAETASFSFPNFPSGLTFHAAALTWAPQTGEVFSVTPAITVVVQ